jgi:hypothetical protein
LVEEGGGGGDRRRRRATAEEGGGGGRDRWSRAAAADEMRRKMRDAKENERENVRWKDHIVKMSSVEGPFGKMF